MGFAWKFGFWFGSWGSIIAVGLISPRIIPWSTFLYLLIPAGAGLILYGLMLNALAGKTLKRYGHMEIKKGIRKPDRLVTEGIYSCMRHPAQFGSIFFGMGIALLTMKLIAILYAGWVSMLALYFILSIEERETIELFGERYCEFMKNRKPFTFSYRCLQVGFAALKNNSKGENI